MKIKIWCDSGANIYSKWENEYDLEVFSITENEWNEMSEEEREDFVREIAFERLDWGYQEIND